MTMNLQRLLSLCDGAPADGHSALRLQHARPSCPRPGRMELSLRYRHSLRNLLPLDPRPQVALLRRLRPLDRPDWPRGLKSLLKAKAWLWSLISTAIVSLVLAYAAFMFHADIWKIALVLIGWFFFSRSMAEKSVTLVTITSESGEVQKIPMGRRLASQLGMLTFAIGIMTQQWHIAVMGIIYSWITAAAMWQNFRARLPYLYDPWSEALPPPPTLMHAMISISILVECGAVVTGILLVIAGPQNIAIAQAIAYGICSVAVSLGVISFLGERNVSLQDVIRWRSPTLTFPRLMPPSCSQPLEASL